MGLRVPATMDDELELDLELELLVHKVPANLDPVHTKLSGVMEVFRYTDVAMALGVACAR